MGMQCSEVQRRRCLECRKVFEYARPHAKYCSDKCRVQWRRDRLRFVAPKAARA